jgi:hypothetical protein
MVAAESIILLEMLEIVLLFPGVLISCSRKAEKPIAAAAGAICPLGTRRLKLQRIEGHFPAAALFPLRLYRPVFRPFLLRRLFVEIKTGVFRACLPFFLRETAVAATNAASIPSNWAPPGLILFDRNWAT